MNRIGNSSRLIYGGLIILVFLCGISIGLIVMGQWLQPSGRATPEVVFVTSDSGASSFEPTTQALSGTAPATPSCDATPPDWNPYVIKAGDTLSDLAVQIGISQNRLLRGNCLTSIELQAGQLIFLPTPPTPTPCAFSQPSNWGLYTVQAGDTLFDLAAERGTTPDQVIQVNCLTSANIIEGDTLYLPILPTPTPCVPSPPAGWELYTVQAGDTLFSLAGQRGTTSEEVTRVNCLTSPNLFQGDQLYLPALPTPTPTLTPFPTPIPPPPSSLPQFAAPALPQAPVTQPPVIIAPLQSMFSRRGDLPGFTLTTPRPGDALLYEYKPCSGSQTKLDSVVAPDDLFEFRLTERGQRRYFFACGFKPTFAFITRSDGFTQTIAILESSPDPDIKTGDTHRQAEAVMEWAVLPYHPIGGYKLTATDNENAQVQHIEFQVVEEISREYILALPPAGPPGTTFQVYYVNFELNETHNFHLFKSDNEMLRDPQNPPRLNNLGNWDVTITQPFNKTKGWAVKPLVSLPTDMEGTYVITAATKIIYEPLWLRKEDSR